MGNHKDVDVGSEFVEVPAALFDHGSELVAAMDASERGRLELFRRAWDDAPDAETRAGLAAAYLGKGEVPEAPPTNPTAFETAKEQLGYARAEILLGAKRIREQAAPSLEDVHLMALAVIEYFGAEDALRVALEEEGT